MVPIIKLFSKLPLGILYLLSYKLYVLMYYIVGYRKKVILENLRNSFPNKSDQEINALRKKFYRRFADFIVETLKGLTMSEAEINKRIRIKNPEVLTPYVEQNKSILFLITHQFNWEWAMLACSLQLPIQIDGIYKRLTNDKMEALMLQARSRFGAHLIEKDNSLMEIMKRGKILKGTAINADQLPVQSSPAEKYWTTFLHQDTAFFLGGERIAKMLKLPVFFMGIRSPKRGYYEIEFTELAQPPHAKDSHEIMKNYVATTEKLINSEPEGWLWSHRRWKYKKSVYAS